MVLPQADIQLILLLTKAHFSLWGARLVTALRTTGSPPGPPLAPWTRFVLAFNPVHVIARDDVSGGECFLYGKDIKGYNKDMKGYLNVIL
jgi:hypothetical protein